MTHLKVKVLEPCFGDFQSPKVSRIGATPLQTMKGMAGGTYSLAFQTISLRVIILSDPLRDH